MAFQILSVNLFSVVLLEFKKGILLGTSTLFLKSAIMLVSIGKKVVRQKRVVTVLVRTAPWCYSIRELRIQVVFMVPSMECIVVRGKTCFERIAIALPAFDKVIGIQSSELKLYYLRNRLIPECFGCKLDFLINPDNVKLSCI